MTFDYSEALHIEMQVHTSNFHTCLGYYQLHYSRNQSNPTVKSVVNVSDDR